MKAIKIDIKQELIETNKPYLDFIEIEPLSLCMVDDGDVPNNTINAKKTRYELVKVVEFGDTRNYLIKLDDKKLVKDLFQISQDKYKTLWKRSELTGEIYWIRLWLGWLGSSKIKRFIFKKQISSIRKSLKEREEEFYFTNYRGKHNKIYL